MNYKLITLLSFLFLLSILTACKKEDEGWELLKEESLVSLDFGDKRYVKEKTVQVFNRKLGMLRLSEDKTEYLIEILERGDVPKYIKLIPVRLPDVQNLSKATDLSDKESLDGYVIRFSGELKEKKKGQSYSPVVLTFATVCSWTDEIFYQ